MSTSDTIGDMLARIRNGLMARHEVVEVMHSILNAEIARILKREGYIADYSVEAVGARKRLRVYLRYVADGEPAIRGLRRVSRPGLRRYARAAAIPKTLGGLGTVIMTTPAGVLTDAESRKRNVGGEILCEVW